MLLLLPRHACFLSKWHFYVLGSTLQTPEQDKHVQEDACTGLQRIVGWEEKGEAALSPLQGELPLSRLCGASSGSRGDEEDAREERTPAFGLQRPLEFASPDTQACQEDSYNPAFESDREQSLSPGANCFVFGGLWVSCLITQSQDVVGGVAHFEQIATHELHGMMCENKGVFSQLLVFAVCIWRKLFWAEYVKEHGIDEDDEDFHAAVVVGGSSFAAKDKKARRKVEEKWLVRLEKEHHEVEEKTQRDVVTRHYTLRSRSMCYQSAPQAHRNIQFIHRKLPSRPDFTCCLRFPG